MCHTCRDDKTASVIAQTSVRIGRNVSAGPSVLCTPRQRCACPACLPCLYALLSHGAFACSACVLMYCSVPAYPWRWRRSTASWSSTGLGVVSHEVLHDAVRHGEHRRHDDQKGQGAFVLHWR